MTEYDFELEAVGPDGHDYDFFEWVASQTEANCHASRDGHHYIHFVTPASSLEVAVKEAVESLTAWNGLQVVGFSSRCTNSGVFALA